MKKFCLILFFIFIDVVKAGEVYYSSYTEYSSFQEEEVIASDIVDVIEEVRYLWYKIDPISNEIQYSDYYSKEAIEGYPYKDINQYKTYYQFRTRDKLDLTPHEVIKERYYDLNLLVLESTKPYTIEANIDWYVNGVYLITFKTENIIVQKNFLLSVPENKILELEQEIDELKLEVESVRNEMYEKEVFYNNYIDSLRNTISNLYNELNACVNNCDESKMCLNKVITEQNEQLLLYQEEINNLNYQLQDLNNQIESYIIKINNYELENENQKEYILNLLEDINVIKNKNQSIQNKMKADYEKIIEILTQEKAIYELNIKELEEKIIKYQTDDNSQNIIEKLKQEQLFYQEEIEKLENEKNLLQEQIMHITVTEEAYYDKIQELDKQNHDLNIKLGQVILDKDSIIDEYKTKIIELEQKLQDNQLEIEECSKLKEEINKTDINLNTKLNDYVLKINGENKTNLFWLYIAITIVLILYLILLLRKKSSIKNDKVCRIRIKK